MGEGEEPDLDFTAWATKCSLKRKTTDAMNKEDLNTKKGLLRIIEKDIVQMGISIGQAKLLREALGEMGHKRYSVPEVEEDVAGATGGLRGAGVDTNRHVLAAAGEKLAALFEVDSPRPSPEDESTMASLPTAKPAEGIAMTDTPNYGNRPLVTMCDPMLLLAVKSGGKKALQIKSFVSDEVRARMNSRRRDRITLGSSEDGQVILRTEESDTFYVTLDEFGAANMRLAAQLVKSGDLAQRDILCYMAYTAKIFDLAGRFDWAIVLRYDAKYRELQAEFGFPWGSQHAHTESHMLLPKRIPNPGQRRGTGSNHNNGANDQICRQFMARGACRFGEGCKFRHVEDQRDGPKNGN